MEWILLWKVCQRDCFHIIKYKWYNDINHMQMQLRNSHTKLTFSSGPQIWLVKLLNCIVYQSLVLDPFENLAKVDLKACCKIVRHKSNLLVVEFPLWGFLPCSIDGVQLPESALCPDAETSYMTTRCQLE